MTPLLPLVALEGVVIALLVVLVAGLLKSHAEVLARIHALEKPRGAQTTPVPAPTSRSRRTSEGDGRTAFDVVGVTPADEAVNVAVHGSRVDTLFAFLSSTCTTCHSLWSALREDELPPLPDRTRVVVVTLGPGEESPNRLRRMAPAGTPVVMSSEAWQDYGVPGAPYFIWVEGSGGRVVGEGSATTWHEVASLMKDAADDGAATSAASREQEVDTALAAAGILPGDPRLHHGPLEG